MDEFEALCRGFLQNAAARHLAVSLTAPDAPTTDYLTGFGAGWEAGHVAGLALAVSVLTGESPSTLIEDSDSQAAIETTFPFDLIIDGQEREAA